MEMVPNGFRINCCLFCGEKIYVLRYVDGSVISESKCGWWLVCERRGQLELESLFSRYCGREHSSTIIHNQKVAFPEP